MNDFLEFNDAAGEPWRVEAGSALRKAFEIHGAEAEIEAALRLWQSTLLAFPELWQVVARRFGVRPQFGVSDPKQLRAWSREELVVEMGRSALDIEAVEMAAVKCWKLRKAEGRRMKDEEKSGSVPLQDENAPPMEAEDAAALLQQYGFAAVTDEAERRYIAERVIALSEVLESDSQAAVCRSMIIQEANLFFVMDPPIRALRDRIAENAKEDAKADQSKDNKQLMDMIAARGTAGDRLEHTMTALGISEKQTNSMRKKASFQDSVSAIIEGIRDYRANGDNLRLDGIFRGAEIEVLTRPFDLRDAQYRPDLAFTVPHAVAGLFDPQYKGPKLPRHFLRKLHMGFKEGLKNARGENGEVVRELDVEAAEEVLDEAEVASGIAGTAMPGMGQFERMKEEV